MKKNHLQKFILIQKKQFLISILIIKYDFYEVNMIYTAHEIASTSELYNKPIIFGINKKDKWECMGYSRSGNSIKFSRLIILENKKLMQINKYVHPDISCIIFTE
jgi:hypothetical protein